MSSKWKYATIPAEQRINMLRNDGNEALYKEELARTQDVIISRLEAGLDVKAQMDWADTVSYNYKAGEVERAGGSADNVARTGYADQLFGNMSVSTVSGTSTVSNPKNVRNPYGATEQTAEQRMRSSYERGINERAQILNSEYSTYVQSLNSQYEKKKKQVIKEYERLEKLYAEKSLNDGYSQYGGRSLTDQLKAREDLVNALAALDAEKNGLILKAQNSLRSQLMDVADTVGKTISDEYYRYSNLQAEKEALEYQKLRDSINDDRKWQEFLYSKERDAVSDSFSEKEYLLALAKLEHQKDESDRDYETRMKEFEADNAYRYRKLDDDKSLAYAKLYSDYMSDVPQNETTDQINVQSKDYKKFGKYYIDQLNMAKQAASLVTNTGDGYRKVYSDREIVNWIKTFNLTEEEKKKICKELGLDYN